MPLVMCRNVLITIGPGIKRLKAQGVSQAGGIHGHVSGTGRYRTGFVAIATHQMGGIVPAYPVDDLSDLVQA